MFDFHAHPTFKPFNSKSIYHEPQKPLPDKELWKERFRPPKNTDGIPAALEKEVNYTSQIHLNALARGRFRGICVSLYPLERVFTVGLKNFKRSFLIKVLGIIPGLASFLIGILKKPLTKKFFKFVATLTGYDVEVVEAIHHGDYHYYQQMKKELKFLVDLQLKMPSHADVMYEIAKDFQSYNRIISEDKLAFIISVEGMNAFLDESRKFDEHLQNELNGDVTTIRQLYRDHVTEFKEQEFPPFIVTLSHHQYNFLAGHSPSFTGIAKGLLNQSGNTIDNQGNQVSYYDLGIKPLGMEMIKLLLRRSVGRRVLIDTKHMSPRARMDYHAYVKQEKANGDHIPIIQTHTGVSGRPRLADAIGDKLELSKSAQNKSDFFTSAINLFDDEIADIVASDGLIGLMLDEKRIMGKKLPATTAYLSKDLKARSAPPKHQARAETPRARFDHNKMIFKQSMSKLVGLRCQLELLKMNAPHKIKKIKRIKNRIDKFDGKVKYYRSKLTDPFLSIFFHQVFHIVKTCEESGIADLTGGKAWDHICIGSDYEGVINPLDIYYYASDLQNVETEMKLFWNRAINLGKSLQTFKDYDAYLFGKTPGYYVKKILWGNSQLFLSKYFNTDYLKQGTKLEPTDLIV